jgi:hypothetical protein
MNNNHLRCITVHQAAGPPTNASLLLGWLQSALDGRPADIVIYPKHKSI